MKEIKKGNKEVIEGINKAVDTIKVTLGPKGKCVAINSGFGPEITRDGATVAKNLSLPNQSENLGVDLVKKAAQLTEDLAGDGTSSTSILIQALVNQGQRYISSGYLNVNEVKSGMEKAGKWVSEYIKKQSIPVDGDLEKIRKVATISANNDSNIGDLIVECMEKVGIDGVITADVSPYLDTVVDITSGLRLDRGWTSPQFVTSHSDATCVMENCFILVCGEKISNMNQLLPVLEEVVKTGNSFLIVCDDMDESVLMTLVINTLNGALRCCVVKGVDFGESRKNLMEDLSVVVGAQYITQEYGLELSKAKIGHLGRAKKVIVGKDFCTILEGTGDPNSIQGRLDIIKERIKDPALSDYDKNKFLKRISTLGQGIAVIRAGGASEVERSNRKATIEDAILASKSAISEGVVPGGGLIFLKACSETEDLPIGISESENLGIKTVLQSLPSIITTIIQNSGKDPGIIIDRIEKSKFTFGYNAKTDTYGDLLEMGVLDSSKVLRVSLENSISAASMCLLIDRVLVEEEKKED